MRQIISEGSRTFRSRNRKLKVLTYFCTRAGRGGTFVKKPNLFIVGMPKSGTSALYYFLKQHPDVFMSPLKEPKYFATDMYGERDRYQHREKFYPIRTEKEYLKLFKKVKNEKIIGEASPQYSYSKVAAKNIHKMNPNAKIIIMLREPADFLYSLHSQKRFDGSEQESDFKRALLLEKKRKKGLPLSKTAPAPPRILYYERAKYTGQIKRYLNVFNKKQIKIIIFEDFKKDNTKVYKQILRFLNVNNNFKPVFRTVNANKVVRFGFLNTILVNKRIRKVMIKLPAPVSEAIRRVYHKTMIRYVKRPALDPRFRKKLMKRCKPEVEKLSRLLKKDLVTFWGYDRI